MYNPYSLEGKTVLVTGASSGIGRATAVECSRMGASVMITARNEGRLMETLSMMDGRGHGVFIADMSDESDIERLADSLPKLDGVVNNAGMVKTMPVQFINREDFESVLGVNAVAPVLLTQKLLKKKKITKGGSIVFTSSVAGVNSAIVGNAMYSASKGAVSSFVRVAALELAPKNIRVNAVCPGMIDTGILEAGAITAEQLRADMEKYPMKRYGRPEEVAYAVVFLLSGASSFITGTNMLLDGGLSLQ